MRHQFTAAERSRGGKTRCQQASMEEARSKGFWTTMETHPFFARKWLRRRIYGQNALRNRRTATSYLLTPRPTGKRKPMSK